ncbi:PqqD family protein [uncultured Jatrophihabitans sp.]|uniref:PqqD family protein n=1 Tax=uncultured Jatrophihabitans sp. TaxID=1610747 RepID=UPI0035CB27AF
MSPANELLVVGGPDVAWRETGGEIVVLDLAGSVYFGLNGMGAELWKTLLAGSSRAELTAQLSRRAGRVGPQLQVDVDQFLADLDEHGLLRRTLV